MPTQFGLQVCNATCLSALGFDFGQKNTKFFCRANAIWFAGVQRNLLKCLGLRFRSKKYEIFLCRANAIWFAGVQRNCLSALGFDFGQKNTKFFCRANAIWFAGVQRNLLKCLGLRFRSKKTRNFFAEPTLLGLQVCNATRLRDNPEKICGFILPSPRWREKTEIPHRHELISRVAKKKPAQATAPAGEHPGSRVKRHSRSLEFRFRFKKTFPLFAWPSHLKRDKKNHQSIFVPGAIADQEPGGVTSNPGGRRQENG